MHKNWHCPVCGAINDSKHAYCSQCAAPAPSTTLRCSTCDHICTPATEDFCPNCGRLLKDLAYSHYLLEHDPVIQTNLFDSRLMQTIMWMCFMAVPALLILGFRSYTLGSDPIFYILSFVLAVVMLITGGLAWGQKENKIQRIYIRICIKTDHYIKTQAAKAAETEIPAIPLK